MKRNGGRQDPAMREKEIETMATKKNNPAPAAPEGFRQLTSHNAPWFHREKGALLFGKILGGFTMNDPDRSRYIQVQLSSECKARFGKGDDAEVKEVEVGGVVSCGINYKMKILEEKVLPEIEAGAIYEIHMPVGEKVKLASGGKTMWDSTVSTRMVKGPEGAVPAPYDPSMDDGADGEF